jgi:Protein of unknown function (DUF1559)
MMARRWMLAWVWLVSCSLAVSAQTPTQQLDVKYIPADSIAMISVRPNEISKLDEFKFMPTEVATAAGMEQVGIDPLLIERIDLVIGMPGPTGPLFGAMITMTEPVVMENLNARLFVDDWQTDGDFRVRTLADMPPGTILLELDDRHAILGTEFFVKTMAGGDNEAGALSAIVGKIKSDQHALVVATLDSLRPLLEGGLAQAEGQIPQPIADDVAVLAGEVDHVAVRMMMGQKGKTQIVIAGQDESGAKEIESSLANLIAFAREQIVAQMQSQMMGDSPTEQAMKAYFERMSNTVGDMIKPKRNKERVITELDMQNSTVTIGVLTGLLLPAVQSAREAARRMSSSNNLRQIGLAIHNFADAYRKLPAPAIPNEDGEALLSWRVTVLPFLEEAQLYNEFHLDEPWDSEHNLTLLPRMPAVYRHPSSTAPEGHTVYLAVVGEETGLMPDMGLTFANITDGTSNSILAVEVDDAAAVPWTSPQDYTPDQDDILKDLRVNGPSGAFNALFFDCSLHMISSTIDPEVLWGLFTRAGGEPVTVP